MSWIVALVGLSLVIAAHEFGHLVVAKLVGMRVAHFSLFFGKPIISFWHRGTEYRLGWVPLGGYIKIKGMSPHEQLCDQCAPHAYWRQPPWKRIATIAAGPAANLLLTFLIIAGLMMIKGHPTNPAQSILSVDGRPWRDGVVMADIGNWECSGRSGACEATTTHRLLIMLKGRPTYVPVRVHFDGKRSELLWSFSIKGMKESTQRLGLIDAARTSFSLLHQIPMDGFASAERDFAMPILKPASAGRQLYGPIGILSIAHNAIYEGFTVTLIVLAVISTLLAWVNLLPILPLDGGQIAVAVLEKIRGRALSLRLINAFGVIGIALLAAMLISGTASDLFNGHY